MGEFYARRISSRSGMVSHVGGQEGCGKLTLAPIMQVHNCITMYQGWIQYPFGSLRVKADSVLNLRLNNLDGSILEHLNRMMTTRRKEKSFNAKGYCDIHLLSQPSVLPSNFYVIILSILMSGIREGSSMSTRSMLYQEVTSANFVVLGCESWFLLKPLRPEHSIRSFFFVFVFVFTNP